MKRKVWPTKESIDKQRLVRVFVSSTFQDMHLEREELVKFTFPELRKRCRERHIELTEVDLRWGVTNEQSTEGKVLPLCIAEIDRCRPFFIGILGERYGHVPQSIGEKLLADYPWLKKQKSRSITEIEILHGALEDSEASLSSLFYFRSPDASFQMEERLQKTLGESYQKEPDAHLKRLYDLKQTIRKKADQKMLRLRENFTSPSMLGQWVLEDLWQIIEQVFPYVKPSTEMDKEFWLQEAFAQNRKKIYICRENDLKVLDDHAQGKGKPLVLVGDSGSGKSTLIANWCLKFQQNHPEIPTLVHYIGSTSDSIDLIAMLRRIMETIRQRIEPETDPSTLPIALDKVLEAFPVWLGKASANGRWVIVLDGLNQLEVDEHGFDLKWLPVFIPANIRLIITTLPGPFADSLQARSWQTFHINPMNPSERNKFISSYLAYFGKSLSKKNREQIAHADASKNPLYLRTLLEELRIFGQHDQLNEYIQYYLEAKSVKDLFEKVLRRLEKDFEQKEGCRKMVQRALSYIWASRKGISETELLALLGDGNQPLPQIYWSPLYLALEESLMKKTGLLNFFHNFLRQAVMNRYMPHTDTQNKAHLDLAHFFENQPWSERKIDELPWQYFQAQCWENLKDCITDPRMFESLSSEEKQYELMSYWNKLEPYYDMVTSYQQMVENLEAIKPSPNLLAEILHKTGEFFRLKARYEDAKPLLLKALKIKEECYGKNHAKVADQLHSLGLLFTNLNLMDKSLDFLEQSLKIRTKIYEPNHPKIAESFHSLGSARYHEKDFEKAEKLYLKSLEIKESYYGKNHPEVAISLNNLGLLFSYQDQYDKAKEMINRALAIFLQNYGEHHPKAATIYNSLAIIHSNLKQYREAIDYYIKAIDIFKHIMGHQHPHLAFCINNLGLEYMNQKKYDDAKIYFEEALEIAKANLEENHPYINIISANLEESKGHKNNEDI